MGLSVLFFIHLVLSHLLTPTGLDTFAIIYMLAVLVILAVFLDLVVRAVIWPSGK